MHEITAYTIGKCIGAGQFGKVYQSTHIPTSTLVALNLINLTNRSKQDLKALRDEIKCHRRLIHPNIVRCLDSFITREPNEEVAVITELCPHGDLMDALKMVGKFGEDRVRVFAKDLAAGLEFLHVEQNMIHRDLKLQNILISSTGVLKICDFGFSHLFEQSSNLALTSVKGTPIYMAPELIEETPYSRLVDIWALGVIIYELATGLPPFYTTNIFKLIEMILHAQVTYPPTMSECLQSLLHGLLQKSPDDRLNWPKLAHHPFLIEEVSETGELAPQDEGLKKNRPTTTDSGVDMSSAKNRNPPKHQEWREIDGLELPASNTLCAAKEDHKIIDSELEIIQWNKLLLETATHAGLSNILTNPSKCSNIFKSLITIPTVFDTDSFQATFADLKDASIVVQRLFVMIGTRNPPAPEFAISDQIRITSRWLCSLTHGLLQLNSTTPQDMNVSYALELTLQLLCDGIQTHVNLSSKSSEIQNTAARLAQFLIQMYLPILPRILYTSINTAQVAESQQSSISEHMNEKWMPVLIPAINAARHLFNLFHMIPKSNETLSNLYNDAVELGVLHSLSDFVHEFWDASKMRLNAVAAVLWALSVLAAPAFESVVDVCSMKGGQLLLRSWGRVLCEAEKALLLNSECLLNVAVEVLASSVKKRNDSGLIPTAVLNLLATVAKSSQTLSNRLCQSDGLVSAAYSIVSRNSDKTSLLLASLECLNALPLSKLNLEKYVPKVLQVLQYSVQEDVQGIKQVAVISGLMHLLVSTTPMNKLGALEEYFLRILKLGLIEAIQRNSFDEHEIDSSCQQHSINRLQVDVHLIATVIAFLAADLTRFATVVLQDCIVTSDAILALIQLPSLLHSVPCARVKAHVVKLLCDARLQHFIRTAPTAALSSHIKLTTTAKDPESINARRLIVESIVTSAVHEIHLHSHEYNNMQTTHILQTVTDSISIVSSETVPLILLFLSGYVLQGCVNENVDVSNGILCRLFQQTRELGPFFWVHLLRSSNCNEAKESALILMDALVDGVGHRKDSVILLESMGRAVQESLMNATGSVLEKAGKLTQKLGLSRKQFS
ncbi:Serine/threonine-protein kinase 36 [Chytriomyces hyalinus]|nr:Serine/threonine-protein kinase 36 [Chytriomyces hyalinus]